MLRFQALVCATNNGAHTPELGCTSLDKAETRVVPTREYRYLILNEHNVTYYSRVILSCELFLYIVSYALHTLLKCNSQLMRENENPRMFTLE